MGSHMVSSSIGKGILTIVTSISPDEDSVIKIPASIVKTKSEGPKNQVGIAIKHCCDFCDIPVKALSQLLKEYSEKTDLGTIDIPSSTLHSYVRPGSDREPRNVKPAHILRVLAMIENDMGKGHSKWIERDEVQEYFMLLQKPVTDGGYGLEPGEIHNVTGIAHNMIKHYSDGCFRKRYDDFVVTKQLIDRHLGEDWYKR